MCPQYMSDMFIFANSNTYSLRSIDNQDMVIPKHNKGLFKSSLHYSGVQLWNSLPINIRTATSLSTFKCALHNSIVSNRSNCI